MACLIDSCAVVGDEGAAGKPVLTSSCFRVAILVKLLNPKLENYKDKDAFGDVFSDIFVAQLGETFRSSHLNVSNLESDITPDEIKS